MAKPWEKFQTASAAPAGGKPWEKFSAPSQYAAPGARAVGVMDGPTPAAEEDEPATLSGTAVNTLRAGVKALDAGRGALTGPAIAAALEAMTGKDVYRASEHLDAVNPTNVRSFPGTAELMDRAGVPEGAKVSDYLPNIYVPHDKADWYMWEKGGMFDPSVRGLGGFIGDIASDPLTYLSFGASAAAKEAGKVSATRAALSAAAKEGKLSQAIRTVTRPVTAAGEAMVPAVEALKGTRAGRAAITAATLPSKATKGLGKKLYDSVLLPLEHEGAKFGKSEVGETLYDAGVMSPFDLRGKGQAATDTLMNARDEILKQATRKGAEIDVEAATKFAQDYVDDLARAGHPEGENAVRLLQNRIDKHLGAGARESEQVLRELPFTRDVEELVPQSMPGYKASGAAQEMARDTSQLYPGAKNPGMEYHSPTNVLGQEAREAGDFIAGNADEIVDLPMQAATRTVKKPGVATVLDDTERVAGPTPIQGTKWKTSAANNAGEAAYNDLLRSPEGSAFEKNLARGYREEVENSVARQLGPSAGADLAELNASAGKLIATKKAQKRVADNMERVANNTTGHVTGTHGIIAGLGGLRATAIKTLLDAGRLGTMPAGYALRKAGEGQLSAPMIDAYFKQKMREQMSPYQQLPEEE